MRPSFHFIALGLALSPMVAAAEPISWSRYQVPESGAAVDIPRSIFSEQAGKPEATRHGSNLFKRYWDAFQERRKHQRLRATLCDLSDRELMDIGTTRGEIDYVASNRSFDPRASDPPFRRMS